MKTWAWSAVFNYVTLAMLVMVAMWFIFVSCAPEPVTRGKATELSGEIWFMLRSPVTGVCYEVFESARYSAMGMAPVECSVYESWVTE